MASHVLQNRELQDDERANVLYSPFRSKTLNPSSWTSKMNFWQEYLKETASENKLIIFDVDKLPNYFERKGIVPKCLPTVLEELQRSNAVKPLEEYKKGNSWLSWGFNVLVRQPVRWGLGQLMGSSRKQTSLYVWPHVLKQISEEVLALLQANSHPGFTGTLISLSRLQDVCSSLLPVPSDDDLGLLVTYLESEQKIRLLDTDANGVLVKFCERGKTSVKAVAEVDAQIFVILEGQKKLERETETLTSKMDGLTKRAQGFMTAGKKSLALHILRRRKLATKALERRFTMLSNLEEILLKIDEARTNEMVLSACQSGLAALKNLNQEMSVDKVDDVMGDVLEALEDSEDIAGAISTSASTTSDLETNAQAEEELDALLKELSSHNPQAVAKNHDENLPDLTALALHDSEILPDVPTHSPSLPDVPTHSPSLPNSCQAAKIKRDLQLPS